MNVENDVVEDLGGNDKGMKGLEREAHENTCMDIVDFFYENGIAFNVASNPSFTKILRSVGSYGRGLKPPTAYELSTSILIKGEGNTQAIVEESIDVSDAVKDATLLFNLLDSMVGEVGEDLVV
ncbi:hypothetical protein Q3G72_027933 [Acer saccharum]|nr:hypothetical protein Q3G72_027933 [Acer saccharum]